MEGQKYLNDTSIIKRYIDTKRSFPPRIQPNDTRILERNTLISNLVFFLFIKSDPLIIFSFLHHFHQHSLYLQSIGIETQKQIKCCTKISKSQQTRTINKVILKKRLARKNIEGQREKKRFIRTVTICFFCLMHVWEYN